MQMSCVWPSLTHKHITTVRRQGICLRVCCSLTVAVVVAVAMSTVRIQRGWPTRYCTSHDTSRTAHHRTEYASRAYDSISWHSCSPVCRLVCS